MKRHHKLFEREKEGERLGDWVYVREWFRDRDRNLQTKRGSGCERERELGDRKGRGKDWNILKQREEVDEWERKSILRNGERWNKAGYGKISVETSI